MKRIVIVGEPNEFLEFLGHALVQEGYHVGFVHGPCPSVSKVTRTLPDLVIVDGTRSFSLAEQLCAQLRGRYTVDGCRALLFGDVLASAKRAGISVLSADAYLERPLHPRALIECVRQLLSGRDTNSQQRTLQISDLVIYPSSFRITRPGKMATLTLTEFRLLYHLATRPNLICRREELLGLLAVTPRSSANRVDVLIRLLRKKVEQNPNRPELICTVNGHGYMLRTPEPCVPAARTMFSSDGASHEAIDYRRQ